MTERLLEGVERALGVTSLAVFLPERRRRLRDLPLARLPAGRDGVRLPAERRPASAAWPRASPSTPRARRRDRCPRPRPLNLAYYFPCRVKGELIAILGRRPQGGPRPPEQRGGRPAAGPGRPGRHRVHERPALPAACRRRRTSCSSSPSTTRTSSRAWTPGSWCSTSTARSCAGTGRWSRSTASGASDVLGRTPGRGLPRGLPGGAARQPGRSAGQRGDRQHLQAAPAHRRTAAA